MTAAALSFEMLVPPGSGQPTSLAYWIGLCDRAAFDGVNAVGMSRAMAYQYDVEEQADRTGIVIAADVDWRGVFSPIAPVQLVRAWSPLPAAVEVLGPPGWMSVEPDALGTTVAACAWAVVDEPAPVRAEPPDHDRFHRLLRVAVTRANADGKSVLIVAKPGWSYEHARTMTVVTRELMERAGFVVQDRHA
jgi:hypothetical protein